MKPRIFISAVTKELRSARQIVANTLMALGYEPIWQDIFGMSGEDIRPMLRKKIDSCSALLQIVGEAYGAEPPVADETFGRISYTQYEALYARAKDTKVYYLVAQDDLPRDAEPESIDVARDESDAAVSDANQRRQLQQAYRASIQSTEHIFYAVQSHPETELAVRRMKDELDQLRRGFRNWMIGVTAALVLIVGGVAWLNRGQQELATSVEEAQEKTAKQVADTGQRTNQEVKEVLENAVKELANPSALAERIRKEINTLAEEKIKALPDEPERARKIAEIEQARDPAARRVDELVKWVQGILKDGASPDFQRAADILQKEGTDQALAYLESHRPATLETAQYHGEQAKTARTRRQSESEKALRNRTLQALILEAGLLEAKLQWEPALALREQVAEVAADWFEARNRLGELYRRHARFDKAEPHLRALLKLASNAGEEVTALNNLAILLQDTNRLAEAEALLRRALLIAEKSFGFDNSTFAGQLSNLARLLRVTNRLAEAEPMYRRALAIFEKSYGTEHNDVATCISNLANLLTVTNRLAEAELLHRRALAIDEKLHGTEHPDVAISLNQLASLLQSTNRLAEAEPLVRRAIVIDEHLYGPSHPQVAVGLNCLAKSRLGRDILAEAEPLFRRALAIDEQSYGSAHPEVATKIGNLAEVLRRSSRFSEAEPLYRRAMAIDENSFGADHTKVAIDLYNLALLLQHTNRIAAAELLFRRALAIREKSFGSEHPDVGQSLWALAYLLRESDRLTHAVTLMRRALSNYQLSNTQTGSEHPHWKTALSQYRDMLVAASLPTEKISELIDDVTTKTGPLTPTTPEVERLLGPAQPVAAVLAELDRQYKAEGKPAIYFLEADQPIAPHLDELLLPNNYSLNLFGVSAFNKGAIADAFVLSEEALRFKEAQSDKGDHLKPDFMTQITRASALRELGEIEQAGDDLRLIVTEIAADATSPAFTKGVARYHLAVCERLLGDRAAAIREAEAWLKDHGEQVELAAFKSLTEQLLSDLNNSKPLPPLPLADPKVEIASARMRYRARADLASLPLKESALPLLDQMLGPAKSSKEVFDALDRQYRSQGKSEIWFLPLTEPISPHLDKILGPLPPLKSFDQK